ncbi:L-histidine N(alpha)-methyltransferase [Winogradskyella immobilis]|uniref:L-histidine N(Alpha)-methyltransferase n=1 Tax=Winogradskyella immobilis TaxID=2816852 RepID=A0ABS8EJA2_9FLAO|nr:L-histidine N(alpha)-methyltransferase [Winogradskyella immobilis]MCC1483111.1 L-histidine N(alpha)-methyltransferase [Winogradskyella immobilis]MCG0015206.1 L-histidine N(alpha)-methyltransferase [Winogradskyella immobilis]
MDCSFAEDVRSGLTAEKKYLLSKYFYDDNGSRIFQEIMNMPEYYLTDAEFEILSIQAKQIIEALDFSRPFNIVELGAGDGFKTFKLLEYLVKERIEVNYVPIDISQEAMDMLIAQLKKRLPSLNVIPKIGDYFEILKAFKKDNHPSLLLFLGANIGNYSDKNAIELLKLFNDNMKKGDKLLIGIDLKKNPITIHNAYLDVHGITRRFNLNLLLRINRELGANFNINNFDFYCYYNPDNGELNSYIVSLKQQQVDIKKIGLSVHFNYNELIWTELSKKYDFNEINNLASESKFSIVQNFLDTKHYFTDSLWKK